VKKKKKPKPGNAKVTFGGKPIIWHAVPGAQDLDVSGPPSEGVKAMLDGLKTVTVELNFTPTYVNWGLWNMLQAGFTSPRDYWASLGYNGAEMN